METQFKEPRAPDFKSKNGGWIAWVNTDKYNKPYLTVTIEGIGKEFLFKNEPFKKESKPEPQQSQLNEPTVTEENI
jgi:hypothetical protein